MTLSHVLSQFAHRLRYEAIPSTVTRRAKLLMLDAIGVAFASSKLDFAAKAMQGLSAFGTGDSVAIGFEPRLPLRDAVLLNGTLVHGLDYDDTYLPGSVHMTASNVPCALGVAADVRASGRDYLSACVVGLEAAARIGLAAKGGFSKAGFQPSSICGTMSSSLVAGRLFDLGELGLVRAQGIALSMASGSMQAAQDGTWSKRIQPGWAAVGGITAAALARGGFTGPDAAYEGRYGIFNNYLGSVAANAEPSLATQQLGEHWEFVRASIKLYPACHQSHAFMNAAIKLANDNALRMEDIEDVRTLVAEITRDLVCEPSGAKAVPGSSYAAQFSLPYAMAACFARRRFTLDEIEPFAYTDPALLALAKKVRYEIDPDSGFPQTRTGEVVVTLRNGKQLRERNEIRPDDPASDDEIIAKFMANTATVLSEKRSIELRERILAIENEPDMRRFCEALATTKAFPHTKS